MKEHCLELVAASPDPARKYNIMREYAQAYVLKLMQDAGCFRFYAFVGGTALRFLYSLPRFSEDLDFSQVEPSDLPFSEILLKVKRDLILAGYQAAITCKEEKTVQSAFIKFEGLLYEAGLSPMKSDKFSVKIEVDTRPPGGAVLLTKVVSRFFPISFLTYDMPSLFSGKIHAILSRKYVKGRDYYDMAWYLLRDKALKPNFLMLSAALAQTGWKGVPVTEGNWRQVLSTRVENTDWTAVERDVTSFLERPEEMKILTKENVLQIIRS